METFLTVLLIILKILGILVLSILCLFLLVLILVLFVPVRYGGNGAYNNGDKPDFHGKVTYLLHILTVRFDLNEDNPLKIKIFGITINKKKNKSKVSDNSVESDNEPKPEQPDGEQSDQEVPNQEQPDEVIVMLDEDGNVAEHELLNETISMEETISTEESILTEEITSTEEAGTFGGNDEAEKKKTSTKNEKYDKIKEYLNILQSDEFKKSFDLCKKQLGVVIKAILPRKWKIEGSAGFDDPATTGKLCAVLGMLSPWTYKHVFLTGDFESEEIHVKGDFKGRIYGITLVVVLIKVYFNKNIRRTIKMFKE